MAEEVLSDELEQLVRRRDTAGITRFFEEIPPGEIARVIANLDEEEQIRILRALQPENAADLVEQVPDPQASALIGQLDPPDAAAILEEMPSNEQADLLAGMPKPEAEAILAEMEPGQAETARELSRYAKDVTGGLMITECLAYPEGATVADVLDDLRSNAERYQEYDVQYAYVTAADGRLVGVLRLRDLLLARPSALLAGLGIREPVSVRDDTPLEKLADLFRSHDYFGIPVVDARGRLLGVVRRGAVKEALGERNAASYLKSLGIVGGEELRTMPLLVRSGRRLSWLTVNILLNVVAASVIAYYQDTLRAAIALAVFLPIISDMSGCTGNQAVAVSIRELALGLVRPSDAFRVWLKEIGVGLLSGFVLGILIAAVAWLWKGNVYLGIVVGAAMALNTLVAVTVGGLVPLLLRRFRLDPALASGPVLTTVTDLCGFLLVLALATRMLPHLTG